MAEVETKLPVKREEKVTEPASVPETWRPFERLRREINRLFDDFDGDFWRFPRRQMAFDIEPFWRRATSWSTVPAVDLGEKEKEYEITAELPGMDESNIEVKLSGDRLTIRGEKKEEKEEKKKDYFLSERRYGSFERSFQVPADVDANKIDATFKKGVLKVVLPKSVEALKNEKRITVKAA